MYAAYKENIHFCRLGIRNFAQLICELVVFFNVFSLKLLWEVHAYRFPHYCLVWFILFHSSMNQSLESEIWTI